MPPAHRRTRGRPGGRPRAVRPQLARTTDAARRSAPGPRTHPCSPPIRRGWTSPRGPPSARCSPAEQRRSTRQDGGMGEGRVVAGQSAPRRVHVVPHTHWDREWYQPFQTFRLRLVDLLDDLLPRLDADPSYAHFMLDGQMAVVDDYLAVRPEAEETIRRLAASGRVSVGPWYILMDEFLVSGETIVRNLELGRQRAAAFGGAMEL